MVREERVSSLTMSLELKLLAGTNQLPRATGGLGQSGREEAELEEGGAVAEGAAQERGARRSEGVSPKAAR